MNDEVKDNVNIRLREGAMSELCDTLTFKVDGLLFPQEYYVKGHEEYKEKCSINLSNVDYGDALNEIGDYYWYNN